MTHRKRNFYFIRDKRGHEAPWFRPDDPTLPHLPRPLVVYGSTFDPLTIQDMRALFEGRDLATPPGTLLAVQLNLPTSPHILTPIERSSQLNYMPVDGVVQVETREEFDVLIRTIKPTFWITDIDHTVTIPAQPKAIIRTSPINTALIIERILAQHGR